MAGDQIYADALNRAVPVKRADTEEEFRERYISAFGAPNMRELLRSVPTYMILDDHEIEDNWVQGRIRQEAKRWLYNLAISAYLSYQWSHGPRNYGKNLFYSFECDGYPFFVLDGRTQRIRDDDDQITSDNHLLGYPREPHHDPEYRGQIDVFCDWLIDQQNRYGDAPKLVVSPTVFVPNEKPLAGLPDDAKWTSDSWSAFPTTRRRVLRTILENAVQNVVFLCGDVHCSNVAEIDFSEKASGTGSPIRAFSVTSSAFYWPFAWSDGNPLDFVHDSRAENDGFDFQADGRDYVMHYKASHFEQEDNFTKVEVDWSKKLLRVEIYSKENVPLRADTKKLA
jgi:alkaline phosphatase D